MNKITVSKALPDQFAAVADIGRRTFYETWSYMNTEEDMQLYMAEAFNEDLIKKELVSPEYTFLLAEMDGELIGYTKLRTDRTYPEFKDSRPIEMERLYVFKTHHERKAGKALMEESIRIARTDKFDWLWLGVYAENHRAINFYTNFGFVKFGIKTFKLGNVIDQDDLMKMKL